MKIIETRVVEADNIRDFYEELDKWIDEYQKNSNHYVEVQYSHTSTMQPYFYTRGEITSKYYDVYSALLIVRQGRK